MQQKRTDWFVNDRFGLFIHWGLYAIPARCEWVRGLEKMTAEQYAVYFSEFNPTRYDPRQWARLARAAGQRYAVLTAKHHDGFCLFDSQLTDFKATNTPAKRDLVREYLDAFRAEGLKVGVYYSLIDWHHPHYQIDRLHPLREDEQAKSQPRDWNKYLDYMHGQIRELMSNYGKLDLAWFDFSYDNLSGEAWRATELVKTVRSLQPQLLMNSRLTAGHEDVEKVPTLGDFATPEQVVPAKGMTDAAGNVFPWEACITMNGGWGYWRDDRTYKPVAQLIRTLVDCVSKNGNLLLNVGPNAKGSIPIESVQRLEAIGRWMEDNGESIYGAGAAPLPQPTWGRYTLRGNTLYAHIFDRPVGPIPLPGLGGRVRKARLLVDGSEVLTTQPWNVANNIRDAFLTLPNDLPDLANTVVAVELQP